MDVIRVGLRKLGAVVFEGHNEVARWPLQDRLHFSSVMKKELVNFWVSILRKAGTLGESMDTAEEDAVDEVCTLYRWPAMEAFFGKLVCLCILLVSVCPQGASKIAPT